MNILKSTTEAVFEGIKKRDQLGKFIEHNDNNNNDVKS